MHADWRDTPDGLLPPPRDAAMLDWLRTAHPAWYADLERLTHALADAPTPEATQAFDQRLGELQTAWRAAGQPDPKGRLTRPYGAPSGGTYH